MPYTYQKSGVFYFQRMVPQDLAKHYRTSRIAFSLRTSSRREAQRLADDLSSKLDQQWRVLRGDRASALDRFLKHQGDPTPNLTSEMATHTPTKCMIGTMSKAVAIYLEHKANNKGETFTSAAKRALSYIEGIIGDKSLDHYSRQDATRFRDVLFARGMAGSSVARTFAVVKAVFNFACAEWGLDIRNPFVGVYFDRSKGVLSRQPFTAEQLRALQEACIQADDDLRWIAAIVSDTGARLSEIVGLAVDDVRISSEEIPHLIIREHLWRSLKTRSSTRTIPLTGCALWGARRAVLSSNDKFLFPRYVRGTRCAANSASAALSKWIKTHVTEGRTMHGLRHSLRDRLRSVECPPDLIDQIGGWSPRGVGAAYGNGYPLSVMAKWLSKIELDVRDKY